MNVNQIDFDEDIVKEDDDVVEGTPSLAPLTHVRMSRVPLHPAMVDDYPPSDTQSLQFNLRDSFLANMPRVSQPTLVGLARMRLFNGNPRTCPVYEEDDSTLPVADVEPPVAPPAAKSQKEQVRALPRLAKPPPTVRYHIVSPAESRKFLIKLIDALMRCGAPMHKIDQELAQAASFLNIKAQFILLDHNVIAVFDETDAEASSSVDFVHRPQGLSLSKLCQVHLVYTDVVEDRIHSTLGTQRLIEIIDAPEPHSLLIHCFFSFAAGFAICPVGFAGSFADALVAGCISLVLKLLNMYFSTLPVFSGVFEVMIAVLSSFAARLLNSIHGHVFCYSAISSAGIVLILPGFTVLQGSLELATRNYITGAIKMVQAVVYALVLAFCLTAGSDAAFIIDPTFRHQRDQMARDLGQSRVINGTFFSTNSTSFSNITGVFEFTHPYEETTPIEKYHYVLQGCYRNDDWSLIFQPVTQWSFFALVPLFILSLAILNGQSFREPKRLLVMILFGCGSFAANKFGSDYIYDQGSYVTTFGAIVVGLLGSTYGHWYPSDAFPVMVPGVLVLLPAGLSVVGGLSENFHDSQASVMTWLDTGLRMLQVTNSITVGLWASTSIVYIFMRIFKRKSGSMFVF